jgi:hypothetical protein
MIQSPIKQEHLMWDRFKEFHQSVHTHGPIYGNHTCGPFVQFATGEVVFTLAGPKPNFRGEFSSLGVSVYATTDVFIPDIFTADGTHIPRTWLNVGGMQTLLFDAATKRVVSVDKYIRDPDLLDRIPERFITAYNPQVRDSRRCKFTAYYAGVGRAPVGGPVIIQPPVGYGMTSGQKDHAKGMRAAAIAKLAIDTPDATHMTMIGSIRVSTSTADYKLVMSAPNILSLEPLELARLALNGMSRQTIKLPYARYIP